MYREISNRIIATMNHMSLTYQSSWLFLERIHSFKSKFLELFYIFITIICLTSKQKPKKNEEKKKKTWMIFCDFWCAHVIIHLKKIVESFSWYISNGQFRSDCGRKDPCSLSKSRQIKNETEIRTIKTKNSELDIPSN